MRSRASLSNAKCEWKKQTARAQFEAERVKIKARAGEILTLGDIYSVANKLFSLGNKGVDLAHEASGLGMSDRVMADIGNECHDLEVYSHELRGMLYNRRMYAKSYPLFESPLQYSNPTDVEERDPWTELQDLLTRGEHNDE